MALLSVEDALAKILAGVKPLPAETVALHQALGRVTAQGLVAKRDQPPFRASAMDGYAVRSADIGHVPVTLKLRGQSAAGHVFKGRVKPGETVRIFTGAPVPQDADTVVIQENTETTTPGMITILNPTVPHANVRERGLDFKEGEELIPASSRLNPRDIGLIAAMNYAKLRGRRKPRIAILATGDELVLPGMRPKVDQILSSNSAGLSAFAQSLGADVIDGGIVGDNLKQTVARIKKLSHADVLVTTGGASVGDHDFVHEALSLAGVRVSFWKIAMRPGKPFMYGRKKSLHVLGLPGNPVAALTCAELFLRPLVAALQGMDFKQTLEKARLTQDLRANDHRQDHLRAKLTQGEDGVWLVTPLSRQDSSQLRNYRESQCLIVRVSHAPLAEAGQLVPILRLY